MAKKKDQSKKTKDDSTEKKSKTKKKVVKEKPKKTAAKKTKKTTQKKTKKATEKKPKVVKKTTQKKTKKATEKKPKVVKKTKKEEEAEKRTLEDELEEQLSDEEIENFKIEKVDMEKLTIKVCEIIAKYEAEGMLQSELWKKLKLSSRDGSRLALKLERRGTINREKILEKGRWTYKLILKKTPISTVSIENAPCLICPVEQKCSLEGEISPRNCQWIEEWVIADLKKPKKEK